MGSPPRCSLALSVALYEWARQTIWGRRFGLGWGDHVPEALCASGPYRYIRHPIYLSYLLAFLAVLIALPHWITAAIFCCQRRAVRHRGGGRRTVTRRERARGRLRGIPRTHRHVPAEVQSSSAW